MDLDDDELKATREPVSKEKIIESLDRYIKFYKSIIQNEEDEEYLENEAYCLMILEKIKRGEFLKNEIF